MVITDREKQKSISPAHFYSVAEQNKTKQRSEQNKKSNCFTVSCLGTPGQSTHFYVLAAFYLLLICFQLQLVCRLGR